MWFEDGELVSVPLRGLWFLISVNMERVTVKVASKVSVPLRGLWFLIVNSIDKQETYRVSFRPLTGFMVLNPYTREAYTREAYTFPSPYGVYGS